MSPIGTVTNSARNGSSSPRFFEVPVVPERPIDIMTQVFRRDSFPQAGPLPWLDMPDALERINQRFASGEITAQEAQWCRRWSEDGYLIIESFFTPAEIDAAWTDYEQALAAGNLQAPQEPMFEGDKVPGRVLNAHLGAPGMRDMLYDTRMCRLMSILLGAKALPFQTIASHKTSQQLQHSDSIHMTTYPAGYLAANWIAFEDIHPDSGPLVYHPRSHRLPYLLSDDLGIPFDAGYGSYHRLYEPAIQNVISESRLETRYFLPKKGDVLLWHANLLHGGSRMADPRRASRRALVCHYFAEGCVCYHDIVGMPASVTPFPFDRQSYLAANPDVRAAGVDPFQHYIHYGRREGRPLRP